MGYAIVERRQDLLGILAPLSERETEKMAEGK
jgi:hypothetical protein